MRPLFCWLALILCGGTIGPAPFAQQQGGWQYSHYDIPVHIAAPLEPIPVQGTDGKRYLVYHLLLTNLGFSGLTLDSVEVSDAARGSLLVRYAEAELADFHRHRTLLPTPELSEMPNGKYPRQIPSGRTGVLFFWLALESSAPLPASLKHRFVFGPNRLVKLLRGFPSDRVGAPMVLDDYHVAVSDEKPVVLGPPLRGGDWRCNNGPAYDSAHQYLIIRGGNVRIAERFGIDFVKIDPQGNMLPSPSPDEITNEMFYGHGAEVLAVGDGTIVFVKDGIPENVPKASGEIEPAVELTRETNAGNWLALELGTNRYAFYAHLQPKSILVEAGDKVRKGQVIARLGNSGNATGPGMHFHVGDRYHVYGGDLNGNEGVPFVFDSFAIGGQERRMELPLDKTVVSFKEAR